MPLNFRLNIQFRIETNQMINVLDTNVYHLVSFDLIKNNEIITH